MCSYRAPVAYPDSLRAGLRVDKLSQRAVTYGVAIFAGTESDNESGAVAHGHFVHVFVDREQRNAVPIPDRIREALATLVVNSDGR
jgi:acyl-CoA thioester hydrolase